jgi:hypothetical protein
MNPVLRAACWVLRKGRSSAKRRSPVSTQHAALSTLLLLLFPGIAWAGPAVGVFFAGLTFKAVVVAVIKAVALGLISRALFKPKRQQSGLDNAARERMVMVRSAVEPHRIVIGQCLCSGPISFMEVSGANSEYLHVVVLLAGHEVQEIGDIYFDDVLVGDLDGSGNVTTGTFAGYARIKKHLGTDTQTADADLVSECPSRWTTGHRNQGIAYVYVRLLNNETAYANGLPQIRALVKGRKLFDPRVVGSPNNPVWSPNPALACRDYLAAAFGIAAASSEINDTDIAAAANAADERVTVTYVTPAFTLAVGSPSDNIAHFAEEEHRLKTGDAVVPSTTGSLAGTGLTAGTVYWWSWVSATGGRFHTSRAAALAGTSPVAIGSAGSGTHTLQPRAVVTASASTDKFTFESDERYIAQGDGVQVATTGTLPTNISALTTYYAIKTRASEMQLATTYARALAGTAIDLGSAGSGTLTILHVDQARFTANGSYSLGESPDDIMAGLLSSMAGVRTFSQGVYSAHAGVYNSPTLTITADDLRGPITGTTGLDARELFNAVRGTYVDQFKFYQPTDFPLVTNASYEAQDNDEQIATDAEFPFCTDVVRAQRLAKQLLEGARRGEAIVLPCKLTMFKAAVWETAEVTIDTLGYADTVFRVTGWRFAWDDNGPGVDLSLAIADSAQYTWAAADATQVAQSTDIVVPNLRSIGAPVGIGSPIELALTAERATSFQVANPNITVVIKADWAAAVEANGKHYEVQWKKSTDSTYNSILLPFSGDTEYRIKETDNSATYNVRVRTVAMSGAVSAWLSNTIVVSPTTVLADTDDLQVEAATVGVASYTEGQVYLEVGSPSRVEIQRITVDSSGLAPIIIIASGEWDFPIPTFDATKFITWSLYREQTGSPSRELLFDSQMILLGNVPTGFSTSFQHYLTWTHVDFNPPAGTISYVWEGQGQDTNHIPEDSYVEKRNLVSIELKR